MDLTPMEVEMISVALRHWEEVVKAKPWRAAEKAMSLSMIDELVGKIRTEKQ